MKNGGKNGSTDGNDNKRIDFRCVVSRNDHHHTPTLAPYPCGPTASTSCCYCHNNAIIIIMPTSREALPSDFEGTLLSLPQSDLPTVSNKKFSKSSNAANAAAATTTKKPDLMLFQLPQSDPQFQKDFYAGKCQLLASNRSASIVSPTTSYNLVTVGTSNTLVVWKNDATHEKDNDDKQELSDIDHDDDDDDDNESSSLPPCKRSKIMTAMPVTSCRLIQPGGSGASFLVGQRHDVRPHDLLEWFEQRRPSKHGMVVSTSTLSNLFQASHVEIQSALSQLPNVVSSSLQQQQQQQQQPPPLSEVEQYWQLVSDEEVLLGQRALTEFMVEEENILQEGAGASLRLDDVAQGISERLVQLLWDQEVQDDALSGSNEDRALAISRKTAFLAQTHPSKRKFDSRLVHLDPHKVGRWLIDFL
jgi:hypothetical protein